MIARLDPFDTFFFRDGKPFSLGDESWADGVFPPAPSVLYGTLRTLYLARNDGFDKSKAELDKATERLIIKGIYLEYGNELVLPIPFDLVRYNENNKEKTHLLQLKEPPKGALYNKLTSHLLGANKAGLSIESFERGTMVEVADFNDYLNGASPAHPIAINEYLSSEPKVGIGRDNTRRSVSEGELFRVDMKRLLPDKHDRATKIVVEFDFEGWNPTETQIGKMGGEGKVVSCEFDHSDSISTPSFPDLKPNEQGKYRFKLYLSTPAIFKNGWFPGWVEKDHKGKFNGVSVQMLAAATDRAIPIGGWDLKEKEPKVMYKAIPAGAVYCFETAVENAEIIKNAFHGKSVSDIGAKEGFGIAFVGKV